ncbi:DUF6231 family protein [Psychrobacter sp. AOP7-B1-24]|uniref:DUF6231 family protein n=1 Tax=Psychrobacter sp. AOP7-B1-24 TaxID=3457645 RepID=UPI00402B72F4
MTKHAASRSDITLPLLINYVDALLPSLATQEEVPKTTDQTCDITDLLWVVEDKNVQLAVKAQLENYLHHQKNDVAIANSDMLQVATLLELTKQQTPERYELACFWLPTLSVERLQHYIPLLMRYRDLYSAHLLIAINNTIDLKAYGFTPFDILSEKPEEMTIVNQAESVESNIPSSATTTLWQFNLYDYKQLPNWLNADYWANPENWGKHRW